MISKAIPTTELLITILFLSKLIFDDAFLSMRLGRPLGYKQESGMSSRASTPRPDTPQRGLSPAPGCQDTQEDDILGRRSTTPISSRYKYYVLSCINENYLFSFQHGVKGTVQRDGSSRI
jgi:hypothetical protein